MPACGFVMCRLPKKAGIPANRILPVESVRARVQEPRTAQQQLGQRGQEQIPRASQLQRCHDVGRHAQEPAPSGDARGSTGHATQPVATSLPVHDPFSRNGHEGTSRYRYLTARNGRAERPASPRRSSRLYSAMTTSCSLVNRPYLFSPISHTWTRPASRIRPAGTATFPLRRSCSASHTWQRW